ncbi:MAG: VOC family protein [Solobacterium sp.]|nr:VOC family protein [Solobacterium sp.]
MEKNGKIKGIHHVSMRCSDAECYEKAIAFYTNVLGLPVYRKWETGILLDTGCGYVEIFNNNTGTKDIGAVRHFALAADNVDAIVQRVQDAGYEVFDGPRDIIIHSDPEVHARIAFCRGELNEEIELFDQKQ